MNLFRKLLTAVIAIVMMLGTGVTAMAEETTYTITINKNSTDKAAHTYGAYQIFKGKLETVDDKDVLSDIQWGDGVTPATVITELNKIGFELDTDATASDVARAISDKNYGSDSEGAQKIADAISAALTTPKGTCEIAADATSGEISGLTAGYYLVKDTAAVTGEGSQTRYILEVVKNVTVNEKASVPSVEKKVKEKNDTTGKETDWQDAADYDIGDSIPYQLTGTLPSTFEEYDTYKVYTFIDTLSEGLTPPAANTITVKVGDTDVTSHFNVAVSGQVITISLKDGEDLRKWTEPALTKDSKFVVDYSATLNAKAKIGSEGNPNTVKLEYTNNPNGEQDGDKGTTPEDKVIVFTYEIKANKVGEDGKTPLEGAGFTLYKKVPEGTEGAVDGWLQIGDEITGVTKFEFKGTDAGQYKLVETTVPAGYNKAEDITFTVVATYDTESPDPQLKSLTVDPEDAGFTFTTEATEDGTHIKTEGIAEGNVVNKKGSTLPSTGGMGTTLFYVFGTILVAAAGILLVSRRRMAE